jgi:ferritin-like metal-binding protein YciE
MTRIRFDGCDLSRAARDTPVPRVYGPALPGTTFLVSELLTSPRELFAARLRQMLWVELQLSEQVLLEFCEQTHATYLQSAFERHLLETERHVTCLRTILHEHDVPAQPEESPAFKGLVDEHDRLVEQLPQDDSLLHDLAHAHAAAMTELLEVAAYQSLTGLAEGLGERTNAILLRKVMEQEELALEQLERATAKLLAEKVESARL